jgi:hypothetical protein
VTLETSRPITASIASIASFFVIDKHSTSFFALEMSWPIFRNRTDELSRLICRRPSEEITCPRKHNMPETPHSGMNILGSILASLPLAGQFLGSIIHSHAGPPDILNSILAL